MSGVWQDSGISGGSLSGVIRTCGALTPRGGVGLKHPALEVRGTRVTH